MPLYHAFALLLNALLAAALWYGRGYTDVDEVKGVPRSVRDNPGSYRSVYTHYTHYTGGK